MSPIGEADAGTQIIESNGFYFLPLDSGVVIQMLPSDLKSKCVIDEYPEWMDASYHHEARIGGTLLDGGGILINIDTLDTDYLETCEYIEVNEIRFKRAI